MTQSDPAPTAPGSAPRPGLGQRTWESFPVRVWRNFVEHEGLTLAAGISSHALFAAFSAIYMTFAIAGLLLGGDPDAVSALSAVINNYMPGLITAGGVVTPEQVQAVAVSSRGALGVTGLIALGTLVWTAPATMTFSRRAVRRILGIPPDPRNYLRLKSYDFLAAGVIGAGLVAGSLLATLGVWTLGAVLHLIGLDEEAWAFRMVVRTATIVVLCAVNAALLTGLFRFLIGTALPWRRIWPGSLLGTAAVTVLQLGFALLITVIPSNPLLATFTLFIGLSLWFRLIGIVMLVAASWIGVSARVHGVSLLPLSPAERRAAEQRAIVDAARARVRVAHEARTHAPWYRILRADRELRAALEALAGAEAAADAEGESGTGVVPGPGRVRRVRAERVRGVPEPGAGHEGGAGAEGGAARAGRAAAGDPG